MHTQILTHTTPVIAGPPGVAPPLMAPGTAPAPAPAAAAAAGAPDPSKSVVVPL